MKNRYIQAVSANYANLIISTVFFLIITPLAIRIMGDEIYGIWTIINAFLLFSSVGTFGMGLVVNKFGAEEGADALSHETILSIAAVIVLAIATLICGGMLIFRMWFANNLVADPLLQEQLYLGFIFIALSLYPVFLGKVFQGYLFSQLRYGTGKAIETVTNIFLWSGAVIIIWLSNNLVYLSVLVFLIQLASISIYFYLVMRKRKFTFQWKANAFRKLWTFSKSAFIQSLSISLFQNFDRLLVGFVLGPSIAGAYSVGTSIGLRQMKITNQLSSVLVPYASKKESLRQPRDLFEVSNLISRLNNVLLMVVGGLLILWMEPILKIWISAEFSENYSRAFQIIILAYILISAASPRMQTLVGIGQIKVTSRIYFSSTILMLLLLYFLSNRWGMIGAAMSNFVMVLLLINWAILPKYLGVKDPKGFYLRSLFELVLVPSGIFFVVSILDINLIHRILLTLVLVLIVFFYLNADVELTTIIKRFIYDNLPKKNSTISE